MDYKIVLSEEEEKLLDQYMVEECIEHKAEACRRLFLLGSTPNISEHQLDDIRSIVREEMGKVLNTHNNRIKSIMFKASLLASKSQFFLIGLLRDFVPNDRKKNLEELYENASKYADREIKKKVK